MKFHRILAVLGLVLMGASIVLMLAGFFAGAAKALLLNISVLCFLLAATVLLILNYRRKQADAAKPDEGEE